MNIRRTIPALLLILTLQACGGGSYDDTSSETVLRVSTCSLPLHQSSFSSVCSALAAPSGDSVVTVQYAGNVVFENHGSAPMAGARVVEMVANGAVVHSLLIKATVAAGSSKTVPFAVARSFSVADLAGAQVAEVSLQSIEDGDCMSRIGDAHLTVAERH